jgi:hypothetical protein
MAQRVVPASTLLAIGLALAIMGCGFSFAPLPDGSIAGRAHVYDYSPSVIQTGSEQQSWWCGFNYNPGNKNQSSDTIQYQSLNLTNHARSGPITVLGETAGAWDSVFTCNPKVIGGYFTNPLGDGENFTYAMYYVGLGDVGNNLIGVAFSSDGFMWKKYPQPVISPESSQGYGVGQPALYNDDQHSHIRIFYEDTDGVSIHHEEAVSSDGIHFTKLGALTTAGIDPNSPTWSDIAFDPASGYWYALFNTTPRNATTTGDVIERGSYGVQLYRICDASLLNGTTAWQLLTNIDTNLNGYEANFLAAFVRDMYGNLSATTSIQMYTSISNPPPSWNASPAEAGTSGDIANWDIGSATWVSAQNQLMLNRYFNQKTYEVTTGWVDPKGGFVLDTALGHLYQGPQSSLTVPLYGCKSQATDYFLSLDGACEGSRILGITGYAYSRQVAGLNLAALYRCSSGHGHFASLKSDCEGEQSEGLLGYVMP